MAASNPDAIVKFPIDCTTGLSLEGALEIATKIGINAAKKEEVAQILLNLYKLFQDKVGGSRSGRRKSRSIGRRDMK